VSSTAIKYDYYSNLSTNNLPMLPSIEMRFNLFSRLSSRGLGQTLLAVGDILFCI